MHQPVNRGQYDENKLHNEAWRQQQKGVQEATFSPPLWCLKIHQRCSLEGLTSPFTRHRGLNDAQADETVHLQGPDVFWVSAVKHCGKCPDILGCLPLRLQKQDALTFLSSKCRNCDLWHAGTVQSQPMAQQQMSDFETQK